MCRWSFSPGWYLFQEYIHVMHYMQWGSFGLLWVWFILDLSCLPVGPYREVNVPTAAGQRNIFAFHGLRLLGAPSLPLWLIPQMALIQFSISKYWLASECFWADSKRRRVFILVVLFADWGKMKKTFWCTTRLTYCGPLITFHFSSIQYSLSALWHCY